jgi:FAD/FMN-containing dehydrogenase
VNDLITAMGGSISAEHGIGIDKIDELTHDRSKTELDIKRTIKRAPDPKNIMNRHDPAALRSGGTAP